MRTSSAVTPWYVMPPLSPTYAATHGGDSGSSVCRGPVGVLVQRRWVGTPLFEVPPLLAAPPPGGPWSASCWSGPVCGASPPRVFEPPRPSDEKLPPGGGLLWSVGGTGAYSAVSVGLVCGRLSADGSTSTA